jgi:hypothetical protein
MASCLWRLKVGRMGLGMGHLAANPIAGAGLIKLYPEDRRLI